MTSRLLFFGTSAFAVPALNTLASDGRFEIVGVVTQPDRPVGRHAVLTPPAVKSASEEHSIKVIQQPEKLKDETFQAWIKEVGPTCDAFVVISYGKILPQWLLDLPKKGVLNVHGSLLPRWRGASPIQAAIAAGDAVSGVSIMLLDALMDHGPVLATAETPIKPDDTGGSLHDRLSLLGAELLPNTLADFLDGKITPQEQDHSLATQCGILTRDDGKIDWSKSAEEIERLVRAYNPWPGTWTMIDGKRLKILKAQVVRTKEKLISGDCFISDGQPAVSCGDANALALTELQREGRNLTSGLDFIKTSPNWNKTRLIPKT